MEKQLLVLGLLVFIGGLITVGLIVRAGIKRDERLDAEAVINQHESDTVRPVTFQEAWDERDAEFMRKWAHVTSRDYEREDKQATHHLLVIWRPAFNHKMRLLIDRAADRMAQAVRLSEDRPYCIDHTDLESELLLRSGWHGYHGAMADTCWTEEDSRQLNILLMQGARHYRKYKKEVRIK